VGNLHSDLMKINAHYLALTVLSPANIIYSLYQRCYPTVENLSFSLVLWPAFLTRFRSEAAQMGMDTRRATERNAVDMPGSAAAV
jgi:hypothetical protein